MISEKSGQTSDKQTDRRTSNFKRLPHKSPSGNNHPHNCAKRPFRWTVLTQDVFLLFLKSFTGLALDWGVFIFTKNGRFKSFTGLELWIGGPNNGSFSPKGVPVCRVLSSLKKETLSVKTLSVIKESII